MSESHLEARAFRPLLTIVSVVERSAHRLFVAEDVFLSPPSAVRGRA
ncbi:MAG: hypothetical protein M3377_08065 [Actinomycetota bacterium]|nr:hypothetical protein [Actinomycetota bacterium]